MPIKFDGRTFSKFRKAVRYVMKSKGWDEERASAYVASIEKKQGVRYKK
jgi:hypothetical protein